MVVIYVIGFVVAFFTNVALFHAHAVNAEPGALDAWDWVLIGFLALPLAMLSWLYFIIVQSMTYNRKSFLTVVQFYSDYTIR